MSKKLSPVIPILRIFDVAKAKEFYIDWLGFTIDWEHRYDDNSPLYMQVSREDIVLHLSEHYGDGCPGSKVFINTRDVKTLQQELSQKNYRYYKPGIESSPWNSLTMQLLDPFSNKLLFNQYLDE